MQTRRDIIIATVKDLVIELLNEGRNEDEVPPAIRRAFDEWSEGTMGQLALGGCLDHCSDNETRRFA